MTDPDDYYDYDPDDDYERLPVHHAVQVIAAIVTMLYILLYWGLR